MAPTHSDVGRLLREAAAAPTYTEQARLVSAAEQARTEIATTAAATNALDLAQTVVAERLTPVRVHEHHTAATDWIGSIDTGMPEGAERTIVAQGSVWYAQLPELVKQHPDELAQQALGMGRRLAGAYGSGADAAEQAFLDHVGLLHGRDVAAGLVTVAASGVPQVGEAGNPAADGPGVQGGQVTMGLPGEMTSSERAPAMQDLMNNTSGGSVSDRSWPDPLELPQQDVDAANGDSGTQRVANFWVSTGHPSDMAWNRWGNWKPGWDSHQHGFVDGANGKPKNPEKLSQGNGIGQAYGEGHDLATDHYVKNDIDPEEHFNHDHSGGRQFSEDLGKKIFGSNQRSSHMQTAKCPACGGHGRVAVRREGASSLDQIDQVVDPHDNPSTTPYPTDVAFPWEMPDDSSAAINEAEQQIAEREQRKGASRKQVAARAAQRAAEQVYRRVLAGQDDSGWLGDNGAGGVGPGEQDGGNPGNTYPGNIADPDPVYGFGGDNGNQPLKPYGADEADDYTNNPGINAQPGGDWHADLGGRGNQVGQPTARRHRPSDNDPLIAQHLAFVLQRRALLDGAR